MYRHRTESGRVVVSLVAIAVLVWCETVISDSSDSVGVMRASAVVGSDPRDTRRFRSRSPVSARFAPPVLRLLSLLIAVESHKVARRASRLVCKWTVGVGRLTNFGLEMRLYMHTDAPELVGRGVVSTVESLSTRVAVCSVPSQSLPHSALYSRSSLRCFHSLSVTL